jgi:hypothetical protein
MLENKLSQADLGVWWVAGEQIKAHSAFKLILGLVWAELSNMKVQ